MITKKVTTTRVYDEKGNLVKEEVVEETFGEDKWANPYPYQPVWEDPKRSGGMITKDTKFYATN